MAQQQGAGLVPYRCTDPTVGQVIMAFFTRTKVFELLAVGTYKCQVFNAVIMLYFQMMYRGSAMPAGSMAGGPGMGIMDGFVNHRAMSSNVRTPFGNEAFIAKHDMVSSCGICDSHP